MPGYKDDSPDDPDEPQSSGLPPIQLDSPREQSSPRTSTSVETILRGALLPRASTVTDNIGNDDNGSQHGDRKTLMDNPVFSDARMQMQMLRGITPQTRVEGRGEGRAEAANPATRPSGSNIPRRPNADRWDLSRHRRSDPENGVEATSTTLTK